MWRRRLPAATLRRRDHLRRDCFGSPDPRTGRHAHTIRDLVDRMYVCPSDTRLGCHRDARLQACALSLRCRKPSPLPHGHTLRESDVSLWTHRVIVVSCAEATPLVAVLGITSTQSAMGNIFKKLLGTKDMRILMLGLDAAGKTSMSTPRAAPPLSCPTQPS